MNLGSIWASIGIDTSKLDKGLMDASAKLAAAVIQVNTMGASLTRNSTKFMMAGGAMVGAVAGIGVAAVKMAKDFDTSMRNVNSIAKLSEAEFKNLSADVVNLSRTLPQSASTLADGLYDISSSGFAGAEGLEVLKASAKAASAGMTDTATSAQGITAVLNAYGMEAEDATKVADIMFATVDKGVITFEELSNSIGAVAGTANIAGIEFNELSGLAAYMTTKGIGADEAMTSLNRVIMGIIDPSEKLAEVLQAAGYESGEAAIKAEGLVGVMKLMDEASGGSLTKLQELSPEMRALKGNAALLGSGYEELTNYMQTFGDTAGYVDEALEEQSKSLDYQLDILKNNASAIGITLGSELVPDISKTVGEISKWIDTNSDLAVSLIKIIGGVGAGGGGLLMFLGVLGKVRGAIQLLSSTALGISGFGTIGLGVAGVTALVWEGVTAWNAYKNVVGSVEYTLADPGKTEQYLRMMMNTNRAMLDDWTEAQRDAARQGFGDFNEEARETAEIIVELTNTYPGLTKEVESVVEALKHKVINGYEAREQLEGLVEDTKEYEEYQRKLNDAISPREIAIYTEKLEELKGKLGIADEATDEFTTTTEEATEATDEQAKSIEELTAEFNELINSIFGGVTTWNDFENAQIAQREAQKQVNELIAEGKENTDEYTSAMNDLDAKNIAVIQSAFEVSQNIELTTAKQKEAKEEAIKLGLQYVNTGEISIESFWKMASEFGVSSTEIIRDAKNMGIEIDEATRDRLTVLDIDDVEARAKINDYIKAIANIPTSVRTKVEARANIVWSSSGGAMGGLITPQGVMQSFASGGVVPQTGRAVPILAHEGELILNSSQQDNLAKALWGVANGRGTGNGNGQPININVIAELDGQVIYEKTSQYIYNQSKINQAGAGIR
jgi:TP901 family phage tail tape measure protein